MKYLTLLIAFSVISSTVALAQHTTHKKRDTPQSVTTDNTNDDDNTTKGSYLSIGANYISNNVYLGRKDSIAVPYISPYIGYTLKNGLYAKCLESYQATKTDAHFDLFTFELGYTHLFWNTLSTSASYDKYSFSDSSENIKSSIKSSLMLSFLYMNNYVEPLATFIIDRTNENKTDIVANFGIDHTFFLLHDNMNIIPTLSANFGTQNYYNEAIIKKETKKGKKVVNQRAVNATNQFELLDYELSVQAIYKIQNWVFLLVPTYALPENPSTTTIITKTGGTNVFAEQISNSFFIELDASYRFYHKKKKKG